MLIEPLASHVMHTVAISMSRRKSLVPKMTARLFFDIGAQPYERRREQPSRDLGVK